MPVTARWASASGRNCLGRSDRLSGAKPPVGDRILEATPLRPPPRPQPQDPPMTKPMLPNRLPVDGSLRRQRRAMTRRQVLVTSSAFAISLITARARAGAGNPFTLGVAAGDPAPDGFVLWTRLAPEPLAADGLGGLRQPVAVLWEVGSDEAMRQIVRTGPVE